MLTYLIITIEGFITLALATMTVRVRRSGSRALLFFCVTLSVMAFCSFAHGFSFGVLQVEGPHGRDEPLLLAGFGLIAAVLPGLPLGMILGVVFSRKRPGATTSIGEPDRSA